MTEQAGEPSHSDRVPLRHGSSLYLLSPRGDVQSSAMRIEFLRSTGVAPRSVCSLTRASMRGSIGLKRTVCIGTLTAGEPQPRSPSSELPMPPLTSREPRGPRGALAGINRCLAQPELIG